MFRKCNEVNEEFFKNHPVLKNHLPLLAKIKSTFQPDDDLIFLKAPGRVNLIGEHTDYNMGPVLPCAIDKEIVFCLRKNDSAAITVNNVNPKFSDLKFSISQLIDPYAKGNWGNYIKAGVKGIIDHLQSNDYHNLSDLCGFDAVVSGTLPLAAGLSSSSALVVAAALSFVVINKLNIEKLEIAEICAKSEHFVGTAGGGMDQAASLLGKKNSFLKMEFNPLRIEPILAPDGLQLVLFHSLIEAEKSGRAREEYNRRVLECRMAVDHFEQYIVNERAIKHSPVNYIGEIKPERFHMDELELDRYVLKFLDQLPNSFTKSEFSQALGSSEHEIIKKYQDILRSEHLAEPPGGFKIKGRFKHVYTECRRVDYTVACLTENNLSELGGLLNASHQSLSRDYEVSLPEVDQLVKIILRNGAAGARIMGAGFGGMILAYTKNENKEQLIERTIQDFYRPKHNVDVKNCIFPCVVADGAGEI